VKYGQDMKLKSLKSQVNNEKNRQIKGKITKSSITFNENKPNLKNIKIGLSPFKTTKYGNLPAWRSKKQTQSKPNSNPMLKRPKMNTNIYQTKIYNDETTLRLQKNKPNSNPNKASPLRIYLGQNLRDLGKLNAISNMNQNHYISFSYRTALKYFINKTWANTGFSLNKYYNTFRHLLLIIKFCWNFSGERHV
jgi:hypothetical protein